MLNLVVVGLHVFLRGSSGPLIRFCCGTIGAIGLNGQFLPLVFDYRDGC